MTDPDEREYCGCHYTMEVSKSMPGILRTSLSPPAAVTKIHGKLQLNSSRTTNGQTLRNEGLGHSIRQRTKLRNLKTKGMKNE